MSGQTAEIKKVSMSRIVEIPYEQKHYSKNSGLHIYSTDQCIFYNQISNFHPDLSRFGDLTRDNCMLHTCSPSLIERSTNGQR